MPALDERTGRALEHEDVVSYGEVTLATLGPGGQRLVEVLLIVSQTGERRAIVSFTSSHVMQMHLLNPPDGCLHPAREQLCCL